MPHERTKHSLVLDTRHELLVLFLLLLLLLQRLGLDLLVLAP